MRSLRIGALLACLLIGGHDALAATDHKPACDSASNAVTERVIELAASNDGDELRLAVICLATALQELHDRVEALRDGTVAFTARPLVPEGMNFRRVEVEAK